MSTKNPTSRFYQTKRGTASPVISQILDLMTDGQCSQAVFDFIFRTGAARMAPTEEDAGSEMSEWVLRVWRRAKALGVVRNCETGRSRRCSCLHPPSWRVQKIMSRLKRMEMESIGFTYEQRILEDERARRKKENESSSARGGVYTLGNLQVDGFGLQFNLQVDGLGLQLMG